MFQSLRFIKLQNHQKGRKKGTKELRTRMLAEKFSESDKRMIRRQITKLHADNVCFDSKELQSLCGFNGRASNLTFRRTLNSMGYQCLVNRRKGVLFPKDKKNRTLYAKEIIKKHGQGETQLNFWRSIALYIDIVGYEWKLNPMDKALTPKSRSWRQRKQGLQLTTKGEKEGAENIRFLVGIGYNKGVPVVHQILKGTSKLDGNHYADIINSKILNPYLKPTRLVVQDKCPVQNSLVAKKAFSGQKIKLVHIPSKSPDINVIENLFNISKNMLAKEAIEKKITKESRSQFAARITNHLKSFSTTSVNKLIDTLPNRMDLMKKNKGTRLRY